jgi:hypothetical protein
MLFNEPTRTNVLSGFEIDRDELFPKKVSEAANHVAGVRLD